LGAPARSSSKEVIAVIKLLLRLRSHTRIWSTTINKAAGQTAAAFRNQPLRFTAWRLFVPRLPLFELARMLVRLA